MEPKAEETPSAPRPQLLDPPATVGRIVHYHTTSGDEQKVYAALVVHVWTPSCVNLAVFDEKGQTFTVYSASKGGAEQAGTWSYPSRV